MAIKCKSTMNGSKSYGLTVIIINSKIWGKKIRWLIVITSHNPTFFQIVTFLKLDNTHIVHNDIYIYIYI